MLVLYSCCVYTPDSVKNIDCVTKCYFPTNVVLVEGKIIGCKFLYFRIIMCVVKN